MSTKSVTAAFSLACLVCLGAGAIPADFRLDFPASAIEFEPLVSPDSAASLPQNLLTLFDRPIEALDKAVWLRIETIHRSEVQGLATTTKTTLVRGPKELVRRESEIRVRDSVRRDLLVCDGFVLAESKRFGDQKPEIHGESIASEENPAARRRILSERSCDGLLPLFRMLRSAMSKPSAQAGRWGKTEVWRVSAQLDPKAFASPETVPGAACRVCFRRDDGWPFRIEFYESEECVGGPIGAIELTSLAIDVPMSEDECRKAFSFPRQGDGFAPPLGR